MLEKRKKEKKSMIVVVSNSKNQSDRQDDMHAEGNTKTFIKTIQTSSTFAK